jgi:hypothetical protein
MPCLYNGTALFCVTSASKKLTVLTTFSFFYYKDVIKKVERKGKAMQLESDVTHYPYVNEILFSCTIPAF